MPGTTASILKTVFPFFGSTHVEILQGDIMAPGVDVDAVVSTDDNYLTMGSGVARLLAKKAGLRYVHDAQSQSPVKAGTVVVTKPYLLPRHGLPVQYVLHGTVIDYDTYDLPLEQVVYQATINCLDKAAGLEVRNVLFPAFATGSGGLAMESCAHQMCTAIKTYLAQERPLQAIYVILYRPAEGTADPDRVQEFEQRNQRFIREANLVLGVPYDPAREVSQTRNFYGRDQVFQQLEAVMSAPPGDATHKRHAVLLGGPGIGKSALTDQLYHRARQPGSTLPQGLCVVPVSLGRVHEETPASFVYRKLLRCLSDQERDPQVAKELARAYADPEMNGERFRAFLQEHADHYPQIVFLVDHLPRLLDMGAKELWPDLDKLQDRVQFIFTATDDDRYQALLGRLGDAFKGGLEEIRLECITPQERQAWIDALYQSYLERSPTPAEYDFFQEEAGRHPSLIALLGHALIQALVRDRLTNPTHPQQYDQGTLAPFFQAARNAVERPRQSFFDLLLGLALSPEERSALRNVTEFLYIWEQKRVLLPDLARGDPQALARLQVLLPREMELRPLLDSASLRRLQAWGYLVDAGSLDTVQFMARPFLAWASRYFGLGAGRAQPGAPLDVEIRLESPQPGTISVGLRRGRGPRSVSAQKELLPAIKDEFKKGFGLYINHQLHPVRNPDPGVFQDIESVASYILAQFTTSAIKSYLQDPPPDSTVLIEMDDALKDLPWELMLEAAYAGQIPFQVGRIIASQQEPHNIRPPVRGTNKVKALLIGDPVGDLDEARNEVLALAGRMRSDPRFEEPDVCIGPEQCQRIALLQILGSGQYGLIHYSGHTHFNGYTSAWQLKDGNDITTNLLTNALQMAPPALVVSSSCESAVGGEPQPVRYEDQTFDLPSAFLQAGVEAYIGTLWEVESLVARRFIETFYDAFLDEGPHLGECLRRAKMACKERGDLVNWLAFILYGDPHIAPADLLPALREQGG